MAACRAFPGTLSTLFLSRTGSFLIALVLVEAIHLGMQEGETKKRIRQELGKRLFENLQEQAASKQAYIYGTVDERFQQFAEKPFCA